jgi:hypothetical protein
LNVVFEQKDPKIRHLSVQLFGKPAHLIFSVTVRGDQMTHSSIPCGDISFSRRCIGPVDDPRDARVKLLALTPEGLRKSEEIGDFISELHQEMLMEINLITGWRYSPRWNSFDPAWRP